MNRLITWSRPLWLLVALVPACGGGDDGTSVSMSDLVSTCKQTCSKEKGCLGAEANALDCDQMCSPSNLQSNMKSESKETCDYDKLRSKLEACLNVECKDLEACLDDASDVCKDTTSSGAGGAANTGNGSAASGGAGTTSSGSGAATDEPASGTGSTASNDDCSVCERANACCQALLGSAGGDEANACSAFSKTQCESASDAARSQFIQVCTQTLQGGAATGTAACK
ncbi:MAG TPA: hypothetical protein VHC69_01740 [Polyangiaceae bacterium]|nr:hypothetical protein [Polyangiaceae bacterium]